MKIWVQKGRNLWAELWVLPCSLGRVDSLTDCLRHPQQCQSVLGQGYTSLWETDQLVNELDFKVEEFGFKVEELGLRF